VYLILKYLKTICIFIRDILYIKFLIRNKGDLRVIRLIRYKSIYRLIYIIFNINLTKNIKHIRLISNKLLLILITNILLILTINKYGQ
jgi:hypothetical protein